jgi:ribonuclease P/MRP protein subunit RPP40
VAHSLRIGPIAGLHPQVEQLKSTISRLSDIVPPFVREEEAAHDPLYEEQLLEWIGLVTLGSTRIGQIDTIDSYLCRYALPEAFEPDDKSVPQAQNLVQLRWHGFASALFVRHIWLILRTAIAENADQWFALSANALDNTSFTVLCHDGESLMLWECD